MPADDPMTRARAIQRALQHQITLENTPRSQVDDEAGDDEYMSEANLSGVIEDELAAHVRAHPETFAGTEFDDWLRADDEPLGAMQLNIPEGYERPDAPPESYDDMTLSEAVGQVRANLPASTTGDRTRAALDLVLKYSDRQVRRQDRRQGRHVADYPIVARHEDRDGDTLTIEGPFADRGYIATCGMGLVLFADRYELAEFRDQITDTLDATATDPPPDAVGQFLQGRGTVYVPDDAPVERGPFGVVNARFAEFDSVGALLTPSVASWFNSRGEVRAWVFGFAQTQPFRRGEYVLVVDGKHDGDVLDA